MIHETWEVQGYLKGEHIHKKCIYRICLLLARWYKEQGMNHMQIRAAIFDWAGQFHVHIDHQVNNIIYQAFREQRPLNGDVAVYVSEADIAAIESRFDAKNSRLAALAILLYAKVYADERQEFVLPGTALSQWTGIAASTLSERVLPELIDFGYISKIQAEQQFVWNSRVKSKSSKYRIHVPLKNEGDYLLVHNDLQTLYSQVFG